MRLITGVSMVALSLGCGAPEPRLDSVGPERHAAQGRSDRAAGRRDDAPPVADPPTLAGGTQAGMLVVTHAGVGSPPEVRDGATKAADMGLLSMEAGEGALAAAVMATALMEDDPRFNAGTGANIRLDGATIQMDASLMTSTGRFAAVGVIERVKNPILVALKILDTPHLFLAGEGATRFAHKAGFQDLVPESPQARAKYQQRMARLAKQAADGTLRFDWREYWNFPGEMPQDMKQWAERGDTVGSVARAADGSFAATLSTGGTSVTLHGRIGDVPVFGAGCYAGPAGAVACTGHGEEIIRWAMARSVYTAMAEGASARTAVREHVLAFPETSSLGLIAVDAKGWGVAANRRMAWGMATGE